MVSQSKREIATARAYAVGSEVWGSERSSTAASRGVTSTGVTVIGDASPLVEAIHGGLSYEPVDPDSERRDGEHADEDEEDLAAGDLEHDVSKLASG